MWNVAESVQAEGTIDSKVLRLECLRYISKTEQKPAWLELIGVETGKRRHQKSNLSFLFYPIRTLKFEMSACKVTNRLFLI